jgi:hypothetical protein
VVGDPGREVPGLVSEGTRQSLHGSCYTGPGELCGGAPKENSLDHLQGPVSSGMGRGTRLASYLIGARSGRHGSRERDLEP